jgi:aminoglycoside phosphotransferase
MLRILLAAAERALEAFHAADNPIDHEFAADLERIAERTRAELAALDASAKHAPRGEEGAHGRA